MKFKANLLTGDANILTAILVIHRQAYRQAFIQSD